MAQVKIIDYTIERNEKLEQSIRYVCKQLVPDFHDVDDSEIKLSKLTGGITNTLYKAKWQDETVLARIYGENTEILIDRKTEIKYIAEISKRGLGPRLYGRFRNGYLYGYTEGTPLNPEDIPKHSLAIARKLAAWHAMDIPIFAESTADNGSTSSNPNSPRRPVPVLFRTLHNYLGTARECEFSDPIKAKKFKELNVEKVAKELQALEADLTQETDICFCHNDLLSLNILVQDDGEVAFIDFEYCGYNYRAYDIANHFIEWTGFELNYDMFPTVDQQREFLAEYLKTVKGGNAASEEEIEKLRGLVLKLTLVHSSLPLPPIACTLSHH
eukprot:GEZU01039036.1.p1 GENE.GEZU01039036.1~~GEZU01039036.1.p1  ORF type:complete len:374 (-),score=97.26 GEZU01039036.1:42-1025(-)